MSAHEVGVFPEPTLVVGRARLSTWAARCSCGWVGKAGKEEQAIGLGVKHQEGSR